MKPILAVTIMGLLIVSTVCGAANDWPQWRGPERNGISHETGLLKEWPKEGPKLYWKITDAGKGYSTPAVVGDRLFLLGNEGLENEFAEALSVKDGKRVWSTRLGKVGNPNQKPNFPAARSTPTVENGSLYCLGSDGDLACLDASNGKMRWQKNLRTEFGGKPGEWAYSESPLIDGDTLVCTPGGSEATLVALNKKTGAVLWKSAVPGGDEAAYASPVIVETSGIRQYVQLLQKGLVGVEARTGKFLWRYPKPVSKYGANIPTPFASDGFVYVGSAGTGGGLVKLKASNEGIEPEQVYFESKLPTAIGGVEKVGDNVYGTTSQALLCFDFGTGTVKWSEHALGAASVCYADGRLYLHGEDGQVGLVDPNPEGYREKGRFTPSEQLAQSNPMEKTWAYPVVANGRLYIRQHGMLWCYDVKGK